MSLTRKAVSWALSFVMAFSMVPAISLQTAYAADDPTYVSSLATLKTALEKNTDTQYYTTQQLSQTQAIADTTSMSITAYAKKRLPLTYSIVAPNTSITATSGADFSMSTLLNSVTVSLNSLGSTPALALLSSAGTISIDGGTAINSYNFGTYVLKSGFTGSGTVVATGKWTVPEGLGSGTAVVSGGLWNVKVPDKDLKSGYVCVANTDVSTMASYPYKVVSEADAAVASIGSTNYTTLAAAITAAKSGDTIKLLSDISDAVSVTKSGLTINLNGHNLTNNDKGGATQVQAEATNTTFTGSGTIAGFYSSPGSSTVIDGPTITYSGVTGTTEIKSGAVTGYMIVGSNTALSISGGTISSLSMNSTSNIAISGGTVNSLSYTDGATVTITGGTFGFDPTAYVDTNNYKVEQSGSTYTVRALTEDEKVAVTVTSSDGTVTGYNTLAKAVAAAEDGATVTLVKDIALDEAVTINSNITLDLGEKALTYSGDGSAIAVASGKTVTAKNGSVTGGIDAQGTLTIEDGSFDSVTANGTVNIAGGVIGGITKGAAGTVNVTGGTFSFDPSEYVDANKYTVTAFSDESGTNLWTVGEKADSGETGEDTGDRYNLGDFVLTYDQDGNYAGSGSFANASGTGTSTYKSIVVTITKSGSGDATLPSVDGYTYQAAKSGGTAKVIDLSTAKTADQIMKEYVSKISFTGCTGGQGIDIVLSPETIAYKTGYSPATGHYYQLVTSKSTWISAYDNAKTMTFKGRAGYMATMGSSAENTFLQSFDSNDYYWFGGTALARKSGVTASDMANTSKKFSDLFTTGSYSTWIWACGPDADVICAKNGAKYNNWADGEPSMGNDTAYNVGREACLGWWPDSGTWNDQVYARERGYFVEYGDQVTGDSGTNLIETNQVYGSGSIPSVESVSLPQWAKDAGLSNVNASRTTAEDGTITITLKNDVQLSAALVIPDEATVVIDLAGHNLTGAAGESVVKSATATEKNADIKANLTVKNSSETPASVTATPSAEAGADGAAAIDFSSVTEEGSSVVIEGSVTVKGADGTASTTDEGGNGGDAITAGDGVSVTINEGASAIGGNGAAGASDGLGGMGGASVGGNPASIEGTGTQTNGSSANSGSTDPTPTVGEVVEVSTAAELKAALESDGEKTVKLKANIQSTGNITVKDTKVLDLGNYWLNVSTDKTKGTICVGDGTNAANLTVTGSGSLQGYNGDTVSVRSGSTLTLESGRISYMDSNDNTNANAITNNGGTVNINGGGVSTDVMGTYHNSVAAINNTSGTVNVAGGYVRAGYSGNKCIANGTEATANVSGGYLLTRNSDKKEVSGGTANITGGTFANDPSAQLGADYGVDDLGSDATYRYRVYNKTTDTVAVTVNGKTLHYASLADALENAVDGATIKLEADAVIDKALTISKNVTLDLNGKALTAKQPITLDGTANFTVTDSSKDANGTYTCTTSATNAFEVPAGTTLNVNAGTISSTNNTINACGGAVNVTGGTVQTTWNYSASAANNQDLRGAINATAGAQVKVSGGTVSGGPATGANGSNKSACGIMASGSETKVEVSGDATVQSTAYYSRGISVTNGASAEIKGGTVQTLNDGLDDDYVSGTAHNYRNFAVYGDTGSQIKVTDGELKSTNGSALFITGEGTKATFEEGAQVTTVNGATLRANSSSYLEINGGEFNKTGNDAVYGTPYNIKAEAGSVKITGGTFNLSAPYNGGSNIFARDYSKKATLDITGGEFNANRHSNADSNNPSNIFAYYVNTSISGGKFYTTPTTVWTGTVNIQGGSDYTTVKGGEFSSNKNLVGSSNFLADGYTLKINTGADKDKYPYVVGVKSSDDKPFVVTTSGGGETAYASFAEAVEAATDGSTIKLETAVTLDSSVTIDKAITLDLNGNAVSYTGSGAEGDAAFKATGEDGKLTVTDNSAAKNGSIEAENAAAVSAVEGGAVAVEAGTIDGAVSKDGTGTVAVTGGTFKDDPTAYLPADGTKVASKITAEVSTGVVDADGNPITVEETFYTVIDASAIAAVVTDKDGNKNYYTNLATAVSSAPAGSTVELKKDAALEGTLTIDKDITLDLGGNTLSSTGDGATVAIVEGAKAALKNGEVKDATGTDGISASVASGAELALGDANGTLPTQAITVGKVVTEGTLAANAGATAGDITGKTGSVVDVKGGTAGDISTEGTLNITSGTVDDITAGEGSNVSVSGGTVTGAVTGDGSISATGGEFTGTDPSNFIDSEVYGLSKINGENGKVDYKVIAKADACVVVTDADGKAYYYESFADAVANAPAGATVALTDDVTLTKQLVIGEGMDITIDLKGHDLTFTSEATGECSCPVLVDKGSLVITDSTATGPVVNGTDVSGYTGGKVALAEGASGFARLVCAEYGGTFELKGGMLDATDSGMCGIAATDEGSEVIVSGGYVKADVCALSVFAEAAVNVTGGVLEALNNAVVSGNGKTGQGGTVTTISGGNLVGHISNAGDLACGVYHPQSGTLSITGGTIAVENGVGVLLRGGTANITGGEINASGTESGLVGDSKNSVKPAAVVVDGNANYPGAADGLKANISGGTFTADTSIGVLDATALTGGEVKDLINVSGGIFNSAVAEDYCADCYSPVDNGDGTYGVKIADYVEATIVDEAGNVKVYRTLQAAFDAAAEGDTVKVQKDIALEEMLAIDKNVTLDLGGKTLSSTGSGATIAIADGKNVTIKNGTVANAAGANGSSASLGAASGITTDNATIGKVVAADAANVIEKTAGEDGKDSYAVIAKTSAEATVTDGNGNTYYYEKIEEAVANAAAGSTVALLKDAAVEAPVALDKNITLDLGGKTLSSTGSGATVDVKAGNVTVVNGTVNNAAGGEGGKAVAIAQGATVTLGNADGKTTPTTTVGDINNDGELIVAGGATCGKVTGSGSVTVKGGTAGDIDGASSVAVESGNAGKITGGAGASVTVTGGTTGDISTTGTGSKVDVTGGSTGKITTEGAVTVSGGAVDSVTTSGSGASANITGGAVGSIETGTGSNASVSGGKVTGNVTGEGTVNVSGGEFDTVDPTDLTVASGFAVEKTTDGGKTTYKVIDAKDAEATVTDPTSGKTYSYTKVEDAVDNAASGSTVKLEKDATVDETLTIDKDLTVDLNGKTIGSDGSGATIAVGDDKNITIKNGTVADATGSSGSSIDAGAGSTVSLGGEDGKAVTTGKVTTDGTLDVNTGATTGAITGGTASDVNVKGGTTGDITTTGTGSKVDVTGGSTGNITTEGAATVTGGTTGSITGSGADSKIEVSGDGTKTGAITTEGTATITGGDIDSVTTSGADASATIDGGDIDKVTAGAGSSVSITGGEVGSTAVGKGATLDATGGNVEGGKVALTPAGEAGDEDAYGLKKTTAPDTGIEYYTKEYNQQGADFTVDTSTIAITTVDDNGAEAIVSGDDLDYNYAWYKLETDDDGNAKLDDDGNPIFTKVDDVTDGKTPSDMGIYKVEVTASTKDGDFSKTEVVNMPIVVQDTIQPTGEITIVGDDSKAWSDMDGDKSFDAQYTEKQTVKIASTDGVGSGLETIKYFVYDKGSNANGDDMLDENQIQDESIVWTTGWDVNDIKTTTADKAKGMSLMALADEQGSCTVDIELGKVCTVYALFTDAKKNKTYISSGGMVLYKPVTVDASTAGTNGGSTLDFDKGEVNDVEIGIKSSDLGGDASIAGVSVDGKELTKDTDYTISDDGITIKGESLKDLPAGTHEVKVSYEYQGVTLEKNTVLPLEIPELPKQVKPNMKKISTTDCSQGKKDGTITGLDTTMEYRVKSSKGTWSGWKKITSSMLKGGKLTGLGAATYEVRVAADGKHIASDSVTVKIMSAKLALNLGVKVKQKKNGNLKVSWGKVKGATSYRVYVQYCGKKFSKKSSFKAKASKKTLTVKKINKKKIKKTKNYKIKIVAYKGKKVMAKSISMHFVGSKNKKYSNPKKLKLNKKKLALKVGKTFKVKAKVKLVDKSKKSLSNKHAAKFRYATSDKSIAKVSKKGKIKAVSKGVCTVYVYAKDGFTKTIKVTVK